MATQCQFLVQSSICCFLPGPNGLRELSDSMAADSAVRMPAYDLSDEAREKRRKREYGGCLLLYWPPLDAADPQRRGEDLIWVGPRNSGERLWRYMQTFMRKGIEAVEAPAMPSEWLHKGRDPDHVLNWLAECLCYWPVFPVEWNSDVGQIRRETGIGPEQPLKWPAKLP